MSDTISHVGYWLTAMNVDDLKVESSNKVNIILSSNISGLNDKAKTVPVCGFFCLLSFSLPFILF